MPFQVSWIKDRLSEARDRNRLAHAYLLTGQDAQDLEQLAYDLAEMLLGARADDHPDFHTLRPESKSRRITIEQVRSLERELRLKAYSAPIKVAVVMDADRMCIGSAEPANAFLKTLEEPPDHCSLFLTSERPDQLLPTIRSRCLTLPVARASDRLDPQVHQAFVDDWIQATGRGVERAYRRSSLLLAYWKELKDQARPKKAGGTAPRTEVEEKEEEARAEARFYLLRDESISALIRAIWDKATPASRERAALICQQLEEMRYAISRNVDPQLSAERCHVFMEIDL